MSLEPLETSAADAYDAIAPVYDDFTAGHDYELWLNNVLPVLEEHGLRGRRLLDVACGTGKSLLPMLQRGWEVTGCDASASMLDRARPKVAGQTILQVADMRQLPIFDSFDLVWCVDDALNYLLSADELRSALDGMRRNLAPNGLVFFDLNTLLSFRTFFAEEVVVERGGNRLCWRGLGSAATPPGAIGEALFTATRLDDPSMSAAPPSRHRERHYPEAQVRSALKDAGLHCLAVYGHHYDAVLHQPLDEDSHTKALYIARHER